MHLTPDQKSELLPCAHCGRPAHTFEVGDNSPYWCVHCEYYGCAGMEGFDTEADAILQWNRRASQWLPIRTGEFVYVPDNTVIAVSDDVITYGDADSHTARGIFRLPPHFRLCRKVGNDAPNS